MWLIIVSFYTDSGHSIKRSIKIINIWEITVHDETISSSVLQRTQIILSTHLSRMELSTLICIDWTSLFRFKGS